MFFFYFIIMTNKIIKQGNRKSWSNYQPRVHNTEIRILGGTDPANRKQGRNKNLSKSKLSKVAHSSLQSREIGETILVQEVGFERGSSVETSGIPDCICSPYPGL